MLRKISHWDHTRITEYEFCLASIGFERRARYICETLNPKSAQRFAIGFADRHVYDYETNLNWFQNNDYKVFDNLSDEDFASNFYKLILDFGKERKLIKGLIDISCLNRTRLSSLIYSLTEGTNCESKIIIDFVYSIGSYSEPPQDAIPNTHFGPVSSHFAGWSLDPSKPPIAIVGLGYEEAKALGSVEYVQSDESWIYIPQSPIEEYFEKVLEANKILLEALPDNQKIKYKVDDPVSCYYQLESLVYGISKRGRPILFPFGPKIFSLIALLVASKHPESSVWRVSAQHDDKASNRYPSKYIVGLTAEFS